MKNEISAAYFACRGMVTSATPNIAPTYNPPFITTLNNSSAPESDNGPLLTTSTPVDYNSQTDYTQYELDLAEVGFAQ